MKFTFRVNQYQDVDKTLADINQVKHDIRNPDYNELVLIIPDRKFNADTLLALRELVSCRYFQKISFHAICVNETTALNTIPLLTDCRCFRLDLNSSLNGLDWSDRNNKLISDAVVQNRYINFMSFYGFRIYAPKLDLLRPIRSSMDEKGDVIVFNGGSERILAEYYPSSGPRQSIIGTMLRNRIQSETWSPRSHIYQVYWKQRTIEACLLLWSFNLAFGDLSPELLFVIFGLL